MAKRGPRKKAQQQNQEPPPQGPPEDPPPLKEAAQAVGEVEPGPEMTPEEVAQLTPEEIADLTVAPEDQADPVPREAEEEAVEGARLAKFTADRKAKREAGRLAAEAAEDAPYVATGNLRALLTGRLAYSPDIPVEGALVSYCARKPGSYRDAVAIRVSETDETKEVLIDLKWGEGAEVLGVRFGYGIRTWKFRE